MAGRTIEFPNRQCHTPKSAVCPSSNARPLTVEPPLDEAQEADRQGMGTQSESFEAPRNPRLRSSGFAREAELSAAIIHRLNQPLTSMLANAQAAKRWLAAEPPDLGEAVTAMDRIVRDARAAGETMERIRALFKQASLSKREATLPDMMSEALRLVLEDPNKREVRVKCQFDGNLPTIRVDPLAIQEVFINLTSNALEAMESTADPVLEILVGVENEEELLVQVIDNGPGIDAGDKIFDAFVTTKEYGLGIGLAVSRSIVEAHGGRLWAENKPGGGAKFCLVLPLSPRKQAPLPAPKPRNIVQQSPDSTRD